MQSRYDDIRERNVRIMAVSVDPPERNREVAQKLRLTFPVLGDPDRTVVDAFGLRHKGASIDGSDIARPATLLIRDGKIAWRFIPDSWRIRLQVDDLLAAIDALPADG